MLCKQISDQIAELPETLSDVVMHAATRAVVDWVAAAMSGAEHPSAVALRNVAASIGGTGTSSIIGSDQLTDPRTAALVNGTASHATEVDDIYRDGIYHPGCPVVAAVLAIGQSNNMDGASLLRAVAIGYEVSCRIAAAMQPSHYRYWHTTGTVGTLGAAIGASVALGLDALQTANALAIATTMAAGLQQSFRSEAMSKPLHAGHAADAGILAALSAANGFTGALDVLEGPAGFFKAMSGEVDASSIIAPWTEPWAVAEVTVKNHTACGHTFAAIDAAIVLREENDFKPDDVESILIETARIPTEVAGNLNPKTEFEAKFSSTYCVSAALIFGSVRLEAFTDTALSDPVIRALMAKSELKVAEEFDSVFPTQRASRVTIRLTSGEVLVKEAWTRHGDPDSPLSDAEISGKFIELATPVLGAAAQTVLDSLWDIKSAASVANVLSISR